jgi:hypothetical protein
MFSPNPGTVRRANRVINGTRPGNDSGLTTQRLQRQVLLVSLQALTGEQSRPPMPEMHAGDSQSLLLLGKKRAFSRLLPYDWVIRTISSARRPDRNADSVPAG